MLPRYNCQLTGERMPEIRKYIGGKDVSARGAFPDGKKLKIEVIVPRSLGDAGVALRIHHLREPKREATPILPSSSFRRDFIIGSFSL